jgi:hypothetical protein
MNANGPWVVHNFADEAHGTMTLLQATAFSVNTIFAQVVMRVGPQRVVDAAHRMGIESPLQPVCSITLGPEGVSPLDMTAAFATLAARGIHHRPEALARVTAADGTVLARPRHRGTRALSQRVADHVTYALSGVVRAGTGTAAGLDRPAAGKTGTSPRLRPGTNPGLCGPHLCTATVRLDRAVAEHGDLDAGPAQRPNGECHVPVEVTRGLLPQAYSMLMTIVARVSAGEMTSSRMMLAAASQGADSAAHSASSDATSAS